MLTKYLNDIKNIFYPQVCLSCTNSLLDGEEVLCIRCLRKLPRTNYHLDPLNPVIKQFWGKVPLYAATAFYHFEKGNKVQNLIHQLKYKQHPEVGIKIGKLMGNDLKQGGWFNNLDLIIPVPLHPNKERVRGYNQSAAFAKGLSETLEVSASFELLHRNKHTSTQTRKHRFERFENVNQVFNLPNPSLLRQKNILLVDDVITTGSTLTACAETILMVPGTTVSIATIAHSVH